MATKAAYEGGGYGGTTGTKVSYTTGRTDVTAIQRRAQEQARLYAQKMAQRQREIAERNAQIARVQQQKDKQRATAEAQQKVMLRNQQIATDKIRAAQAMAQKDVARQRALYATKNQGFTPRGTALAEPGKPTFGQRVENVLNLFAAGAQGPYAAGQQAVLGQNMTERFMAERASARTRNRPSGYQEKWNEVYGSAGGRGNGDYYKDYLAERNAYLQTQALHGIDPWAQANPRQERPDPYWGGLPQEMAWQGTNRGEDLYLGPDPGLPGLPEMPTMPGFSMPNYGGFGRQGSTGRLDRWLEGAANWSLLQGF